ncbi:MAG: PilZ domain-containing protein [Pseudomonadales bacterium]|nr:PilZ domain-containing protein [Pseudomonadales bacterium]MBO6702975.1 PilZ domain-containing protein [Pseudomonadales bacterium]MBO7006486.1 PilZ domain-containing protein [Pseudomonadales bacterium]
MRLDRIEREEDVLVDVIKCSGNPALNDTSLACRTVDVSEGGMKVASNLDFPIETVLGLRLDLSSVRYRLEGEVRWCRNEEKHYVGLRIDKNSQDFVNWTRMFQLDF